MAQTLQSLDVCLRECTVVEGFLLESATPGSFSFISTTGYNYIAVARETRSTNRHTTDVVVLLVHKAPLPNQQQLGIGTGWKLFHSLHGVFKKQPVMGSAIILSYTFSSVV